MRLKWRATRCSIAGVERTYIYNRFALLGCAEGEANRAAGARRGEELAVQLQHLEQDQEHMLKTSAELYRATLSLQGELQKTRGELDQTTGELLHKTRDELDQTTGELLHKTRDELLRTRKGLKQIRGQLRQNRDEAQLTREYGSIHAKVRL
jgi:chromosome segregation ATPase